MLTFVLRPSPLVDGLNAGEALSCSVWPHVDVLWSLRVAALARHAWRTFRQTIAGCLNRLIDRHATVDPSLQRHSTHAGSLCSLRYGHALAADHHQSHVAPVGRLNGGRRPAAVQRFVVAVGIGAVKRQPGRAAAHISKERLERCVPAVAHRNTSSAVVPILLAFRPVAPIEHRAPCVELSRRLAADRVAVCSTPQSAVFSPETPATLRAAVSEIAGRQRNRPPAVAQTFPCNDGAALADADVVGPTLNLQPPEALRGEVEKRWHTAFYNGNNEDHCTCPVSGATPRMPGYQK